MQSLRRLIHPALGFFLSMTLTVPVLAAGRFEVVAGTLLDHETALVWQGLSATAGGGVPGPSSGPWRVATWTDLTGLFGSLPNGVFSVESDTYEALAFFAASEPADLPCLVFDGDAGCFSGWYNESLAVADPPIPAFYNLAIYAFAPVEGSSTSVVVQSTSTIGSYTSSNCLPFCESGFGVFTVRPVPEPSTIALLSVGLFGPSLRLLRRKTRCAARGTLEPARSM
ncbi:MAG: PEP-CTERM sorting domain-containing protein [Caldimonas sp.]